MRSKNLLSLSYGNIKKRDIQSADGLLPESFETYNCIKKDDIVLRMTDLQNDKRSLRSAISTQDGIITSAYITLRCKKIYPKFLAYYLRCLDNAKVFYSMGSGLRQSLTWDDIRKLPVAVPPLDKQKRIADELDHELAEIDEFIAECAQLSALTDECRLAAINSLIEPLLDKTTPIKHLGTLTSGLTLGAAYNEPVITYPYLRVANVQAGSVDLRDIKDVAVPPSVAFQNMLQKDDVLMTEGGDRDKLGRGAIWSDEISPMLHQNHVFAFRCNKEKLLPEFLVYCLESSYARRYFENNARQSTNLASTNSNIVKNFITPRINISKQQDIIKLLTLQTENLTSIKKNTSRVLNLLFERKTATLEKHLSL